MVGSWDQDSSSEGQERFGAWTPPASSLQDQTLASPALQSLASPQKVLGIAHCGALPVQSIPRSNQTKPNHQLTDFAKH